MLSVGELASSLKGLIEGEVLAEEWQRSIYATDASIYEVRPLCIVLPKTKRDVVKIVKYAYEKKIPVTARGGGSGLAGQAVGSGIVIDFSRHLNKIVEVKPEDGYVVVQPGLVKSELDRHLKEYGKFLPPDPSSSDFCTIGGMIANNAGGAHTVKYGSMVDYTLSLQIVLSNGEVIETGPVELAGEDWSRLTSGSTLEAELYREVERIVRENSRLISEKTPKVKKNSSGYRLERLLDGGRFDLTRIFAASEGTLGVILEAKLRILDMPRFKGTAVLHFADREKMSRAVVEILKYGPSAVELLDCKIVELTSTFYPELKDQISEDVKAILLAEFDGGDKGDVKKAIEELEEEMARKGLTVYSRSTYDPAEYEKLWSIRKMSLPIAMKLRRGDKRPTPFVEDTVVEPANLGVYVDQLYSVFKKYGVEGVVYGHAGDGNLHTRPLLNLKDKGDLEKMAGIAEEVFQIAKSHGGSITGEHGDGLVRSSHVEQLYGEEMYRLFRQIKATFDPSDIMNPGKKITQGEGLMAKNLRFGPDYRRRPVKASLNWQTQGGRMVERITGYSGELSYEDEVELCHGCGTCRELSSGRMCPIYRAFGEEVDSCRGRVNLLRWLLKEDGLPVRFEYNGEYEEIIYGHCVQCKMCYIDCPSNVNVGKLMAEARARYASAAGLPKGYRYFIDIDRYGELGCRLAPISNWLLANPLFRLAVEWFAGVDRHRRLPPFKRKTFTDLFRAYESTTNLGKLGRSLVFFYDTYVNYNRPDIGMALVKIFERNGYRTILPPQKSSGLPAILEGDPETGRSIARYNVESLAPYAEKGLPIVTFSPSSGVALKMEYLNVYDTTRTKIVTEDTYDVHEFLYGLHRRGELSEGFKPVERDVLVHLHCHDLVQRIEGDVKGLLGLIPGLKVEMLEKGCCGIGGAFGFVKGNHERSLRIGEELFEAVKQAGKEVYSTGESCALQMEEGSGRWVGLTVDLLREAYDL